MSSRADKIVFTSSSNLESEEDGETGRATHLPSNRWFMYMRNLARGSMSLDHTECCGHIRGQTLCADGQNT